MKATYTSSNGRLQFAVEGATPKDLFSELAGIQEVFDAESRCGVCQSDDLHYRVRTAQKFEFYELVCMAPGCGARFAFGQSKDLKNLFPKRREDGKPLPHGGWSKYDPNSAAGQEYDDHQRTQDAPAAMPKDGGNNELANWLNRLDRDINYFPRICEILLERMQACGPTCAGEYERIADGFTAKKRPQTEDYKACISDLYAALRRFEK